MIEHWEAIDLYKALAALVAGFVLGLERELKDKSAGIKTITIICMGSALFTIISMKVGTGNFDPGRIAANIITGIGFLGAGVIFKEGFNVYGLTTAGIIWISSAIGMSIGFGQFYLAITFLIGSLLIIYSSKLINSVMEPKHKNNKILTIKLKIEKANTKDEIINDIALHTSSISETRFKKTNSEVFISFEIKVNPQQNKYLEKYLIENKDLISFTYQ